MLIKTILVINFLLLLSLNLEAKTLSFNVKGRSYQLVVPEQTRGSRPLLLLLHGCKQSSDIILKGTNLAYEAEKRGFYILIPNQSKLNNPDNCWNWFYSHQQTRSPRTEMGEIVSVIDSIISNYSIDKTKLFVAGLSSGGVLAHSFMSCYPDYFQGVAIHSGLSFKIAENVYEAQTVLTHTTQKSPTYLGTKAALCSGLKVDDHRLKKILIIHGEEDQRVNSLHAGLTSRVNYSMMDYLDDKHHNSSVIIKNKLQMDYYHQQYVLDVTERQFGKIHERLILIKGLSHAWGGGKPISPNFDPDAPSSNQLILSFFQL